MRTGELAMTGMRGLGALIVMGYHYRFALPNVDALHEATGSVFPMLHVFLDFFFIVSGFIIAFVYDRWFDQGVSWASSVKYMMARLGRIYPLHLAMLAVLVVVEGVALAAYLAGIIQPDVVPFNRERADLWSLFTNFFLMQAWAIHDSLTWNLPAWTISSELIAYVVFVGLYFLPRAARIPAMIGVIVIGCFLLDYAMAQHGGSLDLTYDWGTVRALVGFMCGRLIYEIARRDILETPLYLSIAQVIGFTLFIWLLLDGWYDLWVYPVLSIVVWGLRYNGGPAGTVLSVRPIVWLGEISYSIYMVHYVIYIIFARIGGVVAGRDIPLVSDLFANTTDAAMLRIAIMAALTILISHFTYKLIEMPFRNSFKQVGNRLIREEKAA